MKKLVAEKLSQFFKAKGKLYKRQMRKRKHCWTINMATFMIYKVHKIWETKEVAGALLIDIKRAFDHIFQTKLAERRADLAIDNILIS